MLVEKQAGGRGIYSVYFNPTIWALDPVKITAKFKVPELRGPL